MKIFCTGKLNFDTLVPELGWPQTFNIVEGENDCCYDWFFSHFFSQQSFR